MKKIYVKTLLYAYPNVRKIIKRIDELVSKKAMSSMTDFTSCQEQCEKIVKLTVQKGILFEITYYIDKILLRFEPEERAYIEYKFFKTKTNEQLEGIDLSSRNYYRRQDKLLEHICNCFDWLNLSDDWFEKECKRVPYVKKLLQSVILHQNTANYGKKKDKSQEVA